MSLDVYLERVQPTDVFSANITHNLGQMASMAGVYQALWRPEELGVRTAAELLPYLKAGHKMLLSDPAHFKQWNPKNGWGTFEGLVQFLSDYIQACEDYPDATVRVSR